MRPEDLVRTWRIPGGEIWKMEDGRVFAWFYARKIKRLRGRTFTIRPGRVTDGR